MADSLAVRKVTKIAIVNPYLLRGLTESSEMEAIMRFIAAAKNLNIEAVVFKTSEEVYDFDPDFVIPISQQEPKLTSFPTYGLCNNPIKWVTASTRFTRNIFSYDAYLTASPHIAQWLQQVCQLTNKPFHIADTFFTVPKTEFKALDFKKASAAYLGVNWDGLRHYDLFRYLAEGNYLKCYGPRESWIKYPANLYGGKIPFDGFSALKMYAEHGIGLGVNHIDMDDEGVPTCRTFEIPAASAIAICANNSYIKNTFADSVLYVDKKAPSEDLAREIINHIEWVQNHDDQALEMARSAHDIFNRQLSLEVFIQKMVDMHYQVMKNLRFTGSETLSSYNTQKTAKIVYLVYVDDTASLENLIQCIKEQTYKNVNLILLHDKNNHKIAGEINNYLSAQVSAFAYEGISSNDALFDKLLAMGCEWFSILKQRDKLFVNHCAMLMQTYEQSAHDKNAESLAIVFGNSLDHLEKAELPDKIQDHFLLYLKSFNRIGNITPCAAIPLTSSLFKLGETILAAFKATDLNTPLKLNIAMSSQPLEIALHSNLITSSSSLDALNKVSVLILENAVSSLNFPSNLNSTQGACLVDERQRQKMALTDKE